MLYDQPLTPQRLKSWQAALFPTGYSSLRRIRTGKWRGPDPMQVVNRLLDAGPGGFEGGLTTRKYVSMAKVSRTTGFREISDLVKKHILLQNEGRGRSVSYDIMWKD